MTRATKGRGSSLTKASNLFAHVMNKVLAGSRLTAKYVVHSIACKENYPQVLTC